MDFVHGLIVYALIEGVPMVDGHPIAAACTVAVSGALVVGAMAAYQAVYRAYRRRGHDRGLLEAFDYLKEFDPDFEMFR